ncbi:MAG: pilus assembly protein PilM [Psychrilyobacter sp.]|uniref:pilus assembly protein PilM n=1 Tax=Psychrilyobacter sp. TaxID=2586924 RepID=UPI003C74928E
MFKFKVDGALDIGNSGIKAVLYKNKKIDKISYVDYLDMAEEKIVALQESLEILSKKMNLRGKNLIVTIPASKFYVKTLEYNNKEEGSEIDLESKIEEDLEDIISGYTKDEFITQIETVSEKDLYKKLLVITIPIEEIEKILGILSHFKIRVLKIIPDFIALNDLVDLLDQKLEEETNENVMIVDIGGETSKIFMSTLGTLNMLRIVGIGGNDFTEIIKDHEMLDYEGAELEKQQLELGDDENRKYKTQSEMSMFKDLTLVVNELTTQIGNSLEYFNTNLPEGKISKILLTGGGALMQGFKPYFDDAFDLPCEEIDLNLLNLDYKNLEDKDLLSTFKITTLMGALIKEVV